MNNEIVKYHENGYVILNKVLCESNEFRELIKHINLVIQKKYEDIYKVKNNNLDSSQMILKLMENSDQNISYLNDLINALPSLFALYNSKKIKEIVTKFLDVESDFLLVNNQRIRIQAPGRDGVSNLPWHQDSHYNEFYRKNKSLVLWISISDITYEMGPIEFLTGSHNQFGELQPTIYTRNNGAKIFSIDEKYTSGVKTERIETKSGDIVIIDMNVIHKSGSNNSTKTKISSQARFHQFYDSGLLRKKYK